MAVNEEAAAVEYMGIRYAVLRRDIVHQDDPDSDYVHYTRAAVEDDETFDEHDRPIVQVGDEVWDVHPPRKTTSWRVEIVVLPLHGPPARQDDRYAMGFGQTAEEAELDALTKYAADALRTSRVEG